MSEDGPLSWEKAEQAANGCFCLCGCGRLDAVILESRTAIDTIAVGDHGKTGYSPNPGV